MLVLGVDPGLTRCGMALVSGRPGVRLVAEHVEVVGTPPETALPERLLALARAARRLMDTHSPDEVSIERVFSQHNVRSAMGTAQAAAAVMLVAAERGTPVAQHTPTEVKSSLTSNGRADKRQVTAMVTRFLGLAEPPKPADAADALALAVCHILASPLTQRMEGARR